jgi:hypothetical protein
MKKVDYLTLHASKNRVKDHLCQQILSLVLLVGVGVDVDRLVEGAVGAIGLALRLLRLVLFNVGL